MASDFGRFIQTLGGKEKYLGLITSPEGRLAVTVHIHPSFVSILANAGVDKRVERASHRLRNDDKYTSLLTDAATSHCLDLVRQYIDNAMNVQDPSDTSTRMSEQPRGTGLERAFREPYSGQAANVLHQYLVFYDAKFYKDRSSYYGKFCSIVQSSGTGKTRTIIQLMKKNVLGLYMNIRPAKDLNAYPPRDNIPAKILASGLSDISGDDYADRCVAFFTSIFTVLLQELESFETDSSEKLIQCWSQEMCDVESRHRDSFFTKVEWRYDEVLDSLRSTRKGLAGKAKRGEDGGSVQEPRVGESEPMEKAISGLTITENKTGHSAIGKSSAVTMTPSSSTESEVVSKPELLGEEAMIQAYRELVSRFPNLFTDVVHSHGPKLVIAIDEAHKLDTVRGDFRPSHILCRVISSFTKEDGSSWVLFASTTSKVADFSVPARINASLRISQGGKKLFPPFSTFSWDQLAKPLSEIGPEKVAQLGNIIGFGRPLWRSLTASTPSMQRVLMTAGEKLCFNKAFDASNPAQTLAVLGQRFCLDICFGHSNAIAFQAEAVSSYLRVCLDTTEDRTWQTTLYPSEPLLSCAASGLLHAKREEDRLAKLTLALQTLLDAMTSGMIDVGTKGELVSRILYLIAKDLCVRSQDIQLWSASSATSPSWKDEELLDCKPLRVVDYLRFLFGQTSLNQEMEKLFKDWYIDFSHWVSMSQFIRFSGTGESAQSEMRDWLERHWARTCAVQCCHNQYYFDKLIPMYKLGARPKGMKKSATKPHTGCVSYILISDRARAAATEHHLNWITPANATIPDLGQPYIAIQADLRVTGKPQFSLINNHSSTPCLRIYVPGVNSKAYPFLATKELLETQTILQDMLKTPQTPANPIPDISLLKARLQYGDAISAEHMKWEEGIR